jgi:predicted tellurium resistance membrane protein TerC
MLLYVFSPNPLPLNCALNPLQMIMATTDELDGEKFYTVKEGKKLATPLLTCLVCIELSDFVFAVDSIPAVLGVSHDPFIVYSSNIFAILGMRSLYILISQAVAELKYIRPSVAAVLGFVGAKMVAEYFHVEVRPLLLHIYITCIFTSIYLHIMVYSNSKHTKHGTSNPLFHKSNQLTKHLFLI